MLILQVSGEFCLGTCYQIIDRLQKQCFEILSREHIVDMKTVTEPSKKLVRDYEYSKSDNFKKLSVLAQILSFLYKKFVYSTLICKLFCRTLYF